MPKELFEKIQDLSSLIGNTPMLEIKFLHKNKTRIIFAKAEHLNLTGSIKDRMAFHIIQKAYAEGVLKPGDRIIEATSGNTGIAFSSIGRALGHPVTIYMPDWMSLERKNLIRSLGADIVLVSREEGGFQGSVTLAEDHAIKSENVFLPRQFSNDHNPEAHYLTTGPEIYWQLKFRGKNADAFVAGVGTGGTVMGVGNYLKEKNLNVKIHPLEPSNSPTMSTGYKVGKHRIQGISDEFIPPVVKLDTLDSIVSVDDGDAIIMAQKLASTLGMGVGISSGANFIGAVKVLEEMGDGAVVVTVFPDDNKKYLSTDLMKEERVLDGFVSSEVQLTGVKSYKRVCYTCCDPDRCVEASTVESIEGELPFCPRRSVKKK